MLTASYLRARFSFSLQFIQVCFKYIFNYKYSKVEKSSKSSRQCSKHYFVRRRWMSQISTTSRVFRKSESRWVSILRVSSKKRSTPLRRILDNSNSRSDGSSLRGSDRRRPLTEVGSIVIGAGQSYAIQRIAYRSDFYPWDPSKYYFVVANDMAVITVSLLKKKKNWVKSIIIWTVKFFQLKTLVIESNYVGVIDLASEYETIPVGTPVSVAGFGSFRANGASSPVLMKTNLKVVSEEECYTHYQIALQKNVRSILC